MKKTPLYPFLIVLLISSAGYLGCDPNNIAPPINPASNTASSQVHYSSESPPRTANTIILGSFNMQRLGPSKMKDAWVMERLSMIIRQVDLMAIQEITDASGQALVALVEQVNQGGARYAFVVSPRVGRPASGYYEQYAFIYDTQRIAGGPEFTYLVNDELDLLHREPFIGRFAARSTPPFSFTLLNIHTDPDAIGTELDDLASLLVEVRDYEYPEDDIIVLGDLNQGPGKLNNLERIPGLISLIRQPTNTRQTQTFDNFLLDRTLTAEFTGRAGTMDMERMFGITREEALRLSDHLPIWAEFNISEATATAIPRSASLQGIRPF